MVYTTLETLLITNCEVQIWIVQMMVQQISEMKGSQQYMQTVWEQVNHFIATSAQFTSLA